MYDITKPTIWFFHTIDEMSENGVPRLRMLPGQFVPDPTLTDNFVPCDSNLNTQSDLRPRQLNPIGTIFATKFVQIVKSPRGTPFYNAKRSKTETELISMIGGVSADIGDAYQEYLKQSTGAIHVAKEETKKEKEKPKSDSMIDKLLKENPVPTVGKDNFYVEKDVWLALLFNIHQGYNTMLVGDSGTGKTELAMLMGQILKKPVKVFDMGAKQDPISSLVGVHRFDGKSIFDRADFTYAIEEEGIVILDELPRAPLNTSNILFPVLDSRRELQMDIATHGLRSIKVHPNCAFIATANEGYEYTGNSVLDRALKERFKEVKVEWMPAAKEIELLMKRTGVEKGAAEVIVKVGQTIRDLRQREDISTGVSIRHTIYAADFTAAGLTVSKAMEMSFLPAFTIEDERKKIKDLLASR